MNSPPILWSSYHVTDSSQNKDPNFWYLSFYMAFVHSMSLIFTLYCPEDDGIVMLDKIAVNIDDILSDNHSVNVHICGEFNIHYLTFDKESNQQNLLSWKHQSWLGFPDSKTSLLICKV